MDLVMYTLRSVAYAVVEPSLLTMLVILGIVCYIKNRRLISMQKMVLGEKVNSALELTLSQIVLGIFAGIFASLILSHVGVIFNENSGIELLFILSILLMIIKPRFVCFSYSGAILGVLGLLCRYFDIRTSNGQLLFDVNIVSLMTFVGVLHVVESFLVMGDGSKGAIPVFSNNKGTIIGGYALRRYWILPIAVFIACSAIGSDSLASTQSVATPSWWPIMKYGSIITIISSMVLTMFPYFGVIGYSSVTFTRRKRAKAVSSGLFILGYGLSLIAVAQLAAIGGVIGEILSIIYAPTAHEGMLWLQRRIEDKRSPMFVSDDEGLAILEVVPFSQADMLNLKAGEKICLVNGKAIDKEAEIYERAKDTFNKVTLVIKDIKGNKKECVYNRQGNTRLGVVVVPKVVDMERVVSFQDKKFSDVLNDVKNKKDNK